MGLIVAASGQASPSQCYCVSIGDLFNFMLWVLPFLMLAIMFAVELAKELGLDKI